MLCNQPPYLTVLFVVKVFQVIPFTVCKINNNAICVELGSRQWHVPSTGVWPWSLESWEFAKCLEEGSGTPREDYGQQLMQISLLSSLPVLCSSTSLGLHSIACIMKIITPHCSIKCDFFWGGRVKERTSPTAHWKLTFQCLPAPWLQVQKRGKGG